MSKKQQNSASAVKKRTDSYYYKIAKNSISRTRQDISSWQRALRQADNMDNPRRTLLQNLYKDISLDALLTSQLSNRINITTSSSFSIRQGEDVNDEITAMLASSNWFTDLIRYILESRFYGTTVVELITDELGNIKPVIFPRTHVIPEQGFVLWDVSEKAGFDYRNSKEYGTYVLEFGDEKDYGLLNRAIPHVLFKKFAHSCWSELCEVYGIPPRVIKTNTQDPRMLSRAESMMRDFGASAWFIIDETESFEFARGADTNGDVYANLIRLCNNEMSMLISGAVIGQDTEHGNESKENVSMQQFVRLCDSDKQYVEKYMNSAVMGALYQIGILPEGCSFSFDQKENLDELYTRTIGFLPYFDIDSEWVKQKFSIEVTGAKQFGIADDSDFPESLQD